MFEILIGAVIILGTGVGMLYFGRWIGRQTDRPIGFWANGKPMDSKAVPNITDYNRAYGRLICIFAVPALLAGVLLLLSGWKEIFATVSLAVLIFWGTGGILWLIVSYKKLENQYISR